MGMERRGCIHSIDIRHWSPSIWGLWMDNAHAFTTALLSWGDLDMHLALHTGHHTGWICRFGSPGHIPEDAGRCQDWLTALTRLWHSQEAAPRDG